MENKNNDNDKIVWGMDRMLWLGLRQALLSAVDVIERYLQMDKKTAELRKMLKKVKD